MAAKKTTCQRCGGTEFNVLDDTGVVCQHCGTAVDWKPERKYNRGVKESSGPSSFWDGLSSFLLFEYVGGGFFGCLAMVFVLTFLGIVTVIVLWFTTHRDKSPAARRPRTTASRELTDEQKAARSIELVKMAADRVQRETQLANRILRADEANPKMFPPKDAWNVPLRYEPVDGQSFLIRSAGPDHKYETEDDIVDKRPLSPRVEDSSKKKSAKTPEAKSTPKTGNTG